MPSVIDLFARGTALVFEPVALALIVVGVVIGLTMGSLPGMTATMTVAVLVSFTFGREPVQGMLLLGIDGGRCMRGRSRRSSSERRGRRAPPRRCSTDFHPVSVHSAGYVRVGSVTLLLQKCLRIGPVLPKRLKTGLENGHRTPSSKRAAPR